MTTLLNSRKRWLLSWETFLCACALALVAGLAAPAVAADSKPPAALQPVAATSFARLALRCVNQEFPNKLDHVMNDATEVRDPKALHPAFYGCFDWHSSVHGHWMLARLLRLFPDLPEATAIRRALDNDLQADKIATEVRYLDQANRKSFERTYGWAWLLKLSAELHSSSEPDFQRWALNLDPLAQAIVARYFDFLPRQTYPIRTGVHPNTAFGLALALDYAEVMKNAEFEQLLKRRAKDYYGRDRDYPANWEPGGEDFLSPALMEAELMRRVLSPGEFQKWFRRFLPQLGGEGYPGLLKPAVISDRTDPKLVHLDGLNLSRAWCMKGIGKALPAYTPARKLLIQSAESHLRTTLPHITSGNYEGEHWLASFAVLALGEHQP